MGEMSEVLYNKGFTRLILVGIIVALCSSGITAVVTLSATNTKRDIDITVLQTEVTSMSNRLDKQTNQFYELQNQIQKLQLAVSRVGQKIGIENLPGEY